MAQRGSYTLIATEKGRVVHLTQPAGPMLKAGHEVAQRVALCGTVGKRIHVKPSDTRRTCLHCKAATKRRRG